MAQQKVRDLSEHNTTNIDWKKVKASKVWIVPRMGLRGSMKSTPKYYGKIRQDFNFAAYLAALKKYKIPYSFYFFPTSISDEEAKGEGNWIINKMHEMDIELSMPVWLDSEMVDKGRARADGLSREQRTRFLKIITDMLWAEGVPCGIYASEGWFYHKLDMSKFPSKTLDNTWCAQYDSRCTYTGKYAMWQYTSKEVVPGIPTAPGKGIDTSLIVGEFNMGGYVVKNGVAVPAKTAAVPAKTESAAADSKVKSNAGLLAYAKAQLGEPYWWGTFGQTATQSLLSAKRRQYPSYYTASDFQKQLGKRVHDCVGLIKGYLWSDTPTSAPGYVAAQDVTAAGMYARATKKGTISSIPDTPGLCVFKGTSASKIHHIGVYGADGYIYEAKGHAWGVVKTPFKASEWDYWAQCPFIKADAKAAAAAPATAAKTEKTDDVHTVKYYAKVTTRTDPLNVRTGPGTKYAECSFSPIPKGAKVGVCQKSGKWYLVKYGGKWGYVYGAYITKI